jgi:3',5'-cyclic AMP phosphodiesterase CpdA
MIATLLFAAATTIFPPLPQLDTGAPPLGNGNATTKFTFYVGGDNRPDKGPGLSDSFVALINQMQSASPQPRFVIWGGDAIEGKSATDVNAEYATVRREFGKLGVAVFNAPGNHELNLKGPTAKCHDAPDASGPMLASYTSQMGRPYGVFYYGNSAFIALNTDDSLGSIAPPACYNGFVGATQLAQFKATLASLPAAITNVFLFMHRPVYDDNGHQIGPKEKDANTPYGRQLNAFVAVMRALKAPRVKYVFASHDHRYWAAPPVKGAPLFVISGGGGAPLSGCPKNCRPGAYYHWLQVDVDGDAVRVTQIPLKQ